MAEPIVQLSNFFQQLCAKMLYMEDIKRLEDDIVYILCKFEQNFPMIFFVSMIHFLVRLPEKVRLVGPVSYRWMYPIERYTFIKCGLNCTFLNQYISQCLFICKMLGTYKKYVWNRAQLEGSIAEAYVAHESLTFCAMYLQNVETPFNRTEGNFDGGFRQERHSVFSQVAQPFMRSSSIPSRMMTWRLLSGSY